MQSHVLFKLENASGLRCKLIHKTGQLMLASGETVEIVNPLPNVKVNLEITFSKNTLSIQGNWAATADNRLIVSNGSVESSPGGLIALCAIRNVGPPINLFVELYCFEAAWPAGAALEVLTKTEQSETFNTMVLYQDEDKPVFVIWEEDRDLLYAIDGEPCWFSDFTLKVRS